MKATALFASIAALAILAGAYSTTRQQAEREAWRLESAGLLARIADLEQVETAGSGQKSSNPEEAGIGSDIESALARLSDLEVQILDRRAELAQLKSDRLVADDRASSALETLRHQVQKTTEIQQDLGALQSRRLQLRQRTEKAEEQLDQVQGEIKARHDHVALLDRKIADLVIRQEAAKARVDFAKQEEASTTGALAALEVLKESTGDAAPAPGSIKVAAVKSTAKQTVETKAQLAPMPHEQTALSEQDRSKGLYRFKHLAVDPAVGGPALPVDQQKEVANLSDPIDEQTASDSWALQQHQLGVALVSRGEQNSGTRELNEAVLAFKAVLGEWSRESDQLRWAAIQNDLGYALALLGQRKRDVRLLEEAAVACRKALREIRQDQNPLFWATAQHNLGLTLSGMATIKDDAFLWQNAIEALQQSMEVFEEAGAGPEAERTKARLENAHDQLTAINRDS